MCNYLPRSWRWPTSSASEADVESRELPSSAARYIAHAALCNSGLIKLSVIRLELTLTPHLFSVKIGNFHDMEGWVPA